MVKRKYYPKKKHIDHSDCELILLERLYNPHNRWDLRCVTHRTHIQWLNTAQAQAVWDQVAHRQLHSLEDTW